MKKNNYFPVVVVFGLIFVVTVVWFWLPSLTVLKRGELVDVLMRDDDGFLSTLGEVDLKVRGARSVEHYRELIRGSPCTIGWLEWVYLYYGVLSVWWFFWRVSLPAFDGWSCNRLPWVVGIVEGSVYEGGHPHVRARLDGAVPVIVLPRSLLSRSSLSSVLVHEKIHVYQKSFPALTAEYFVRNGFTRVGVCGPSHRANPDLDSYIYADSLGRPMMATYRDDAATIMDVDFSPVNEDRYEHPLEYMAYTIENMV